METLNGLSTLNSLASTHLSNGELEDAYELVNDAVVMYRTGHLMDGFSELDQHRLVMLQSLVRISILMLEKIGREFQRIGNDERDEDRIVMGVEILCQAADLRAICEKIETQYSMNSKQQSV
jgi:hypothetical protein